MTQIADDVLKAMVDCREAIMNLEQEYEKKRDDLNVPFRVELEKLLVERQPLIASINWGNVLDNPDAPTKPFLNGTTDGKILRAIESFKVTTSVRDGAIFRKIEMKLKSNVFVESHELFREVDACDKTVSVSGIKWKPGTEKSRSDSLFRFFDESVKSEELLIDAVTAFEIVFQNPYLWL
mmetsp:Transcript_76576/g.88986  ORF Transcript_76576/g.88986 Transcript_76576/m.88986 type:complete len:180 (+) Transcript_76576:25-564(+)